MMIQQTKYLALHDSVEPLGKRGWKDGLCSGAYEKGAEENLDGRPDQHQVAHHQRGLVDHEVVRRKQDSRDQ